MSDYYDLSKPFSIENWNKLIRDVNEKLQNPPDGGDLVCQPIYPINLATDPHIWSVSDVQDVRGKMSETCPDISFSEPLEIWKPAIIDEIETALEEMWCYCCADEFRHEEHGTRIIYADYAYTIYHGCPGGTTTRPPNFDSSVLEGMRVAKSGLNGRTMLIRYILSNGLWMRNPPRTFAIPINCDGTLGKSDQSFNILGSYGHDLYCGGLFGGSRLWEDCCNDWIWVQYVFDPWMEYAAEQENLLIEFEISTEFAVCAEC